MPLRARLLCLTVVSAGALITGTTLADRLARALEEAVPPVDWLLLGGVVGLALISKQWPIPYAPQRKVDASPALYFLLLLLTDFYVAVPAVFVCEAVGQILLWWRGKRGPWGVTFNVGQHTIAAVAGGLLLSLDHLLVLPFIDRPSSAYATLNHSLLDHSVLLVLLAGLAIYLINEGLVSAMTACATGHSLRTIWRQGRAGPRYQTVILLGLAAVTYAALVHPRLIPIVVLGLPAMCLTLFARASARVAEHQQALERERSAVTLRDQFLGIASHELRTPITTLKGHCYLLMRQVERHRADPEVLKRNALLISQQASKLTTLIEQLLDVSRIESGKLTVQPAQTNLTAVVAETVEAMRAGTGRSIRLLAPQRLDVWVDATRMDQVVMNLVSNALKFSPEHLPVDVSLACTPMDAPPSSSLSSLPSPPGIVLQVRDYGSGIPEDQLINIFDRYFQVHGEGSVHGLGIGLYVSRDIVALHGGTIHAANCPDGGACFTVFLPMVPAPMEESLLRTEGSAPGTGILVA